MLAAGSQPETFINGGWQPGAVISVAALANAMASHQLCSCGNAIWLAAWRRRQPQWQWRGGIFMAAPAANGAMAWQWRKLFMAQLFNNDSVSVAKMANRSVSFSQRKYQLSKLSGCNMPAGENNVSSSNTSAWLASWQHHQQLISAASLKIQRNENQLLQRIARWHVQ
jgi:hypothetical protein